MKALQLDRRDTCDIEMTRVSAAVDWTNALIKKKLQYNKI